MNTINAPLFNIGASLHKIKITILLRKYQIPVFIHFNCRDTFIYLNHRKPSAYVKCQKQIYLNNVIV